MKKVLLSIGLAIFVLNATACSETSQNAEVTEVSNAVEKKDDKKTMTNEEEMEADAKTAAEATCTAVKMFPKVITDDTKRDKATEEASVKANEIRAAMEKKYTVASGDWAKFEKRVQELMNGCK